MVIQDICSGSDCIIEVVQDDNPQEFKCKVLTTSKDDILVYVGVLDYGAVHSFMFKAQQLCLTLLRHGKAYKRFQEITLKPNVGTTYSISCDNVGELLDQEARDKCKLKYPCVVSIEREDYFNATLEDIAPTTCVVATNARGMVTGARLDINFYDKVNKKSITVKGVISNARATEMIRVYSISLTKADGVVEFIKALDDVNSA